MSSVEFSFTGFTPWGKEPINPSMELVQELRDKFAAESIRVLYTRVIPVTAIAATAAVTNLHTALGLRVAEYPETTQVLIHLGLDAGSGHIALETIGRNLAKIKGEVEGRIVREFPEDHRMYTPVPLMTNYGQKIRESDSAGSFVCNYVYYLSLLAGMQSGVKSLFIHVPLFDRFPKPDQLRHLAIIVKGIEASYRNRQ